MREQLDTIPIIFFEKNRSKEADWKESPTHTLMDVEHTDTDVISLNILGYRDDYQLQFKLSAFLNLLKARDIPLKEE